MLSTVTQFVRRQHLFLRACRTSSSTPRADATKTGDPSQAKKSAFPPGMATDVLVKIISDHPIAVFTRDTPKSRDALKLIKENDIEAYKVFDMDQNPIGDQVHEEVGRTARASETLRS